MYSRRFVHSPASKQENHRCLWCWTRTVWVTWVRSVEPLCLIREWVTDWQHSMGRRGLLRQQVEVVHLYHLLPHGVDCQRRIQRLYLRHHHYHCLLSPLLDCCHRHRGYQQPCSCHLSVTLAATLVFSKLPIIRYDSSLMALINIIF